MSDIEKLSPEDAYTVIGDLIYDHGRLPTIVDALQQAQSALKQQGALERVRERVKSESMCGIMRSMDNTIRSNAMKDVIAFIDHELGRPASA